MASNIVVSAPRSAHVADWVRALDFLVVSDFFLAWTRANIHDFGGDPRFVAVAGCSAGGHLAALTGLAPHDREFNAELTSGADPSVDAVVSLYGRYDWTDRSTRDRDEFVGFLENVVVRKSMQHHREVFDNASPSPASIPTRHHSWSFTATPITSSRSRRPERSSPNSRRYPPRRSIIWKSPQRATDST
jgi:acetyl esterase/lipase